MCDVNMEKSFIVSMTCLATVLILINHPKWDATDEIITWARQSNYGFIDLNVFGNPIDPMIMSRDAMVCTKQA